MAVPSVSDGLGDILLELRKARGLTREEVARDLVAAGYPEISAMVLMYIENGRRNAAGKRVRDISVDELYVMAEVYGLRPTDLLEHREPDWRWVRVTARPGWNEIGVEWSPGLVDWERVSLLLLATGRPLNRAEGGNHGVVSAM